MPVRALILLAVAYALPVHVRQVQSPIVEPMVALMVSAEILAQQTPIVTRPTISGATTGLVQIKMTMAKRVEVMASVQVATVWTECAALLPVTAGA
jgi:hypothetical protein